MRQTANLGRGVRQRWRPDKVWISRSRCLYPGVCSSETSRRPEYSPRRTTTITPAGRRDARASCKFAALHCICRLVAHGRTQLTGRFVRSWRKLTIHLWRIRWLTARTLLAAHHHRSPIEEIDLSRPRTSSRSPSRPRPWPLAKLLYQATDPSSIVALMVCCCLKRVPLAGTEWIPGQANGREL
jgi:hypothetical protein